MTKIRVLPENLSNKIAAGEVVERPASVVKELVENAIDAGSSRILVEIEQGGRKRIRVSDNGEGMSRDDALLCLERYATSKILREPDLFSIRTLGFRGEALPSIASVSRFTLITREKDAHAGTQIDVAGGRINNVSDAGAPAGTMISVANLFYNTPARRKFLKSINTEMGHIADTIASMALCRPSIQFRLVHNNRAVKSWAAAAAPVDRVADVLGSGVKKDLVPVNRETNDVRVGGWIAAARMNRSTARSIYLFVNGRWIKDRVVQHALFAGYSGRLMKGQYPVAVLFLKVPFDQVDVNVHPTKHEVRFIRQKSVHDTVRDTVAETLRQSDPTRRPPTAVPPFSTERQDGVAEARGEYRTPPLPGAESKPSAPRDPVPASPPVASGRESSDWRPGPPPSTGERPAHPAPPPGQHARQEALWTRPFFSSLTVIGQAKSTYIICESDQGLLLIDQHAAHERIVFEQLKRQAAQQRPASQRLLLPETVDLGFREAQILNKLAPELDRYGLDIEPFGGNTFVVKAVPTLLDSSEIPAMITRLVEKAAEIGVSVDMESILDSCLMVMACHNAVRAHQQLSGEQIKAMLEQLDACENPSHCPHGRPIWIQWGVKELEKRFQRIVN